MSLKGMRMGFFILVINMLSILLVTSALAQDISWERVEEINVAIKGEYVKFEDVPGVKYGNRTFVPIRTVSNYLKYKVEWDGGESKVTITNKDQKKKITLVLGSQRAYVNGKAVSIDSPALKLEDRVLVPIRFVSETMGLKVEWAPRSRLVLVQPKVIGDTRTVIQYVYKALGDQNKWKITDWELLLNYHRKLYIEDLAWHWTRETHYMITNNLRPLLETITGLKVLHRDEERAIIYTLLEKEDGITWYLMKTDYGWRIYKR